MNRFSRPATVHQPPGNGLRQALVVVLGLGALLVVAALATDQIVTAARHRADAKIPELDADEIYTGSIVYIPKTDDKCHQWLFDNRSGRFTDNGAIDCEVAESEGMDGPEQTSAARIKGISDGFRTH